MDHLEETAGRQEKLNNQQKKINLRSIIKPWDYFEFIQTEVQTKIISESNMRHWSDMTDRVSSGKMWKSLWNSYKISIEFEKEHSKRISDHWKLHLKSNKLHRMTMFLLWNRKMIRKWLRLGKNLIEKWQIWRRSMILRC